jgi:hypothetical protein
MSSSHSFLHQGEAAVAVARARRYFPFVERTVLSHGTVFDQAVALGA